MAGHAHERCGCAQQADGVEGMRAGGVRCGAISGIIRSGGSGSVSLSVVGQCVLAGCSH